MRPDSRPCRYSIRGGRRLKNVFLRESSNQPLIVIFEDLHWIDNKTQGFLDMLSENEAKASILLLINYRPEYRDNWVHKTHYSQVHLTALTSEEAAELLMFLLGNDASLTALKQVILQRTEGTPFFMEEVVRTLAEEEVLLGERGDYRLEKAPSELHISPTVQGVLAARIDRLMPAEKALLQQLAVIGREFPLALARKVVTESEDELHRLLSSLQAKEFLYEQPAFPEVEYIFKHALTQEVAYGTVLQEQRKRLHEETARGFETLYAVNLDDYYTELAHHYTRGGNTAKAIEYLHLAGQQAAQLSAYSEAIEHLSQALELLHTLDDTPARAQQELVLQLALARAQTNIKGYGSQEAGLAYARANELCRQLGDRPEVRDVLMGLWAFHLTGRSELKTARKIAEQLLRLAQEDNDPISLLKAHTAMSTSLYFQGELLAAHGHTEHCIGLFDAELRHDPNTRTHKKGYLGVMNHGRAALTLWLLGYSAQAVVSSTTALDLAQELADTNSLAWALTFAAMVHRWRGELQATREHARAAVTLSNEQGFMSMWAQGTILHDAALTRRGHNENQVREAGEAVAILRDSRMENGMPHLLTAIAEIHAKAGRAADGLSALNEAREICTRRGERYFEAEIYRLEGELRLQSTGEQPATAAQREAEACFEKALQSASGTGAKSLELRAATSLARLWQQQGKQAEARHLLAEIYNWFSEGFDTKDLKDAKALLAGLE